LAYNIYNKVELEIAVKIQWLTRPVFIKFQNFYFKTLFGFENCSRLAQKWKQSRTSKDLSPCK